MTIRRRDVLLSALAAPVLASCGGRDAPPPPRAPAPHAVDVASLPPPRTPIVAATWWWGRNVCETAKTRLAAGDALIDAMQAGIRDVELDPRVTTVGLGGLPNEAGVVQLDAMVMRGSTLDAGAVGALEGIATPLAVARRVMDQTKHVLLVGAGAADFARTQGFATQELLTADARAEWERFRAGGTHPFLRTRDDHDTVGAVGVDPSGEVIVALSTSGLAWKLPGRIGDSPLVGAGGYADAEVGAACATGVGEEVIRVAGAHAVVERMRAGDEPAEAVAHVLRRMRRRRGRQLGDAQVAFIALRRDGTLAAAALRPGFQLAVLRDGAVTLSDVEALAG